MVLCPLQISLNMLEDWYLVMNAFMTILFLKKEKETRAISIKFSNFQKVY